MRKHPARSVAFGRCALPGTWTMKTTVQESEIDVSESRRIRVER
ncbi:hypothetical protein [Streptomyces endocoffeicus]|nr:hypothetical protein [Streptomyces endocoffeicus]